MGKSENTKRLKINYLYNFISQILTLLIPFLTAPYLARIFHESGSGQIAYANNIITYFMMVAHLGFNVYGQREIAKHRDDPANRSKVFFEIVLLRAITTVISLSILALTVSVGLFGADYSFLILSFGIQVFACAVDVTFFLQGLEKFKLVALGTLLFRVSCLILIFALVKSEHDLVLYAFLYSSSSLVANLLLLIVSFKYLNKVRFNELRILRHLGPSIVFLLPTLAVTIYGSLDKLMIGYLVPGVAEGTGEKLADIANGNYNQALKLNQTMLIPITVIDAVFVTRNSHDFAAGNTQETDRHLDFAISYVWHLSLPMIVGVLLLASNISSWYLGDGYTDVPLLLQIMSVRFVVSGMACVFGNELFIASGREWYTIVAHICTAVSNLVLNFIFIPWLGAVGGAITTAAAEIVDFLVLAAIAFKHKEVSLRRFFRGAVKPLVAALLMAPIVYYSNRLFGGGILAFFLSTLFGAIFYVLVLLIFKDGLVITGLKSLPFFRKATHGVIAPHDAEEDAK